MTNEEIARVCHEVNRAYCQALGDNSQLPWESAPDWQRNSAMMGVELHLSNPDAGPQASHESWMAQKTAEGWVYGPVKDPETKRHPCMVPFAQLPVDQQAKDFIFRGVVHALGEYDVEIERCTDPARKAEKMKEVKRFMFEMMADMLGVPPERVKLLYDRIMEAARDRSESVRKTYRVIDAHGQPYQVCADGFVFSGNNVTFHDETGAEIAVFRDFLCVETT